VQLFHRNHRGITLTEKGQRLLPYAQQMLSLVENAKAAVSDAREVGGTLQIGSLQSTASARLPDVLKVYAARHARVDIGVATGTSAELVAKVLESRLDGAFVSGVEDHPDLDVIASFVEELVIITPAPYQTVRAFLKQGAMAKLLVFKVGCHYRHGSSAISEPRASACSVRWSSERSTASSGASPRARVSMLPRRSSSGLLGERRYRSTSSRSPSVCGDAVRHPQGAGALAGAEPADRRDCQR
jgi:DNA-binding transcriptional LysR family regulator